MLEPSLFAFPFFMFETIHFFVSLSYILVWLILLFESFKYMII